MHHIALDRAGPNNRHFDHHIVKTFWFHPRQGGHLGATFDLEYADRVGALHDLERLLVVFRNMCQIESRPVGTFALLTQLKRILHYRHHAEA